MKLYLQQILHRDINIDNIFLGKKADGSPADPGYRGLLIDLYLAIRIGRDTNKLSSELRSVCSNFQFGFDASHLSAATGIAHVSLNGGAPLLQKHHR